MEGPRSGRFDRYRIYMIVNVVVSATISASNRCVVRIYSDLFCRKFMLYSYYLYLFTYANVQHDFHIGWYSCLLTSTRWVPLGIFKHVIVSFHIDIQWCITSCGLNSTSTFSLLSFSRTIGPGDIVSALTWFIRYMYYWIQQLLNNIITIIMKTKVLLPKT